MTKHDSNTPIIVASDHAGLPLKEFLMNKHPNFLWKDLGTHSVDSVDYPDYADHVAKALLNDSHARGLLLCGTGQGMAIRANKYPHIRAALCWTPEIAQLTREHNNANVLCMGSRVLEHSLCDQILIQFLNTEYSGGRHDRRVEKLSTPLATGTK